MASDDQPGTPQDLLAQLRATLERFGVAAGQMPGMPKGTAQMFGMPAMPKVPLPGGLAAGQVAAIVGAIRAQRSTVESMRTSLDAYEQQLLVLEQLLEPLETMTNTWAEAERGITGG
jgi:hypothetical protein